MIKPKNAYLIVLFFTVFLNSTEASKLVLQDTTFILAYQDELDTIFSLSTERVEYINNKKVVHLTTGFLKNGRKDSVWRYYQNKALRKIGKYKNGLKNGEFRKFYYHLNSLTTHKVFHFKNDTLNGKYVELREDLSLFIEINYKMGYADRIKVFNLEKKIHIEQSFADGALDGWSIIPYNKKYSIKTKFANSKVISDAFVYDRNENLKITFVLSEDKNIFIQKIIHKKNGKKKPKRIRRRPCKITSCKAYINYYFPHQGGYIIDI